MNTSRRIFTQLSLIVLASAGVYGGACGDGGGGDPSFEVERVIYEGQATRAALSALLADKARTSTAQTSAFDAPAAGEALSAGAPPTFRWHVEGAATGAVKAPRSRWARELWGPPRRAFGHDPPVNGRAYFLVFASGDTTLLGVFTTRLDYTPSAEDWALLAGADQPLQVSMLSGIFVDSALADGGGPFLGAPLSLSISASP